MNVYTHHFYACCPVNGVRVGYTLRIESSQVIPVEQIVAKAEGLDEGFHEDLADQLLEAFGGTQTMDADHHGVHIQTIRRKVEPG